MFLRPKLQGSHSRGGEQLATQSLINGSAGLRKVGDLGRVPELLRALRQIMTKLDNPMAQAKYLL